MIPVARGDGQLRGGLRAFFKRRAWRILSPYYITLVLSLALIYLLGPRSKGVIPPQHPSPLSIC